MNLTKEAFDEWKSHPVTKEIFEKIRLLRLELFKQIADGHTIGQSADVTHGLTNRVLGHVEGLDQLLGIDFTDEEDSND